MLLGIFLPLGVPPKDKFRVAPVREVAIVSKVDDCTAERLGDGIAPAACRSLIESGSGLVLRFRYDVKPCGGDRCTTATNIRYAVESDPEQLLWPGERASATGTHSIAIDEAGRTDFCITLKAVRLPENAISPTSKTCVHISVSTSPVPVTAATAVGAPATAAP